MTVQELGERMSAEEFNKWAEYVNENGPLNPMLRMESMIARVAAPFLKNKTPRDLMVWPKLPEPDATPEALALMFRNLATASKRKH